MSLLPPSPPSLTRSIPTTESDILFGMARQLIKASTRHGEILQNQEQMLRNQEKIIRKQGDILQKQEDTIWGLEKDVEELQNLTKQLMNESSAVYNPTDAEDSDQELNHQFCCLPSSGFSSPPPKHEGSFSARSPPPAPHASRKRGRDTRDTFDLN